MNNAVSDKLSASDIEEFQTKENAFILVDNSNIWIQGKKTCGELQKLRVENRSWRINYGKLVNLMLECAGLPCSSDEDIKSSVAYGRLFGSFLPPDDTIWSVFREHLDVDLSGRSRFSGKEKQVDAKFVDLAARDSHGLWIMKKYGLPCAFDSRIYCLAGGDGDYYHTVEQILQCGLRVILFSWKNGLGQRYPSLRRTYPSLMQIVELDEFILNIGFEQTEVCTKDFPIPANRSFYIVRPNGLSIKHMEDFQRTTDKIHAELKRLHHVPSCICAGVDQAAGAAAIVINTRLTVRELTECIASIRQLYERTGFSASCVYSHPEYHSPSSQVCGGTAVPVFNLYSVLFNQDDDDDEPQEAEKATAPAPVVEVDEQFVINRLPPRAAPPMPTVRCCWREFCWHALKCTYLHSDKERGLFCRYISKAPYTMRKMCACKVTNCTRGKTCHYRHTDEPPFCTRCAKYPCMGEPCNDSFERDTLAPLSVIVDLKNKGYMDP